MNNPVDDNRQSLFEASSSQVAIPRINNFSSPGIDRNFSSFSSSSNSPVTPLAASIGGGDGLRGEYFNNIDFTNPILTRTDSTVNFDWGLGSPERSIAADTFSVRWTGQIQALFSETYTFYTTSDDGVRLWVNNQLIINRFIDQPATEWSGSIRLEAGTRYDIRMEYYENSDGAVKKLAWSSTSQRREIIPQSQLFSRTASTPPPTSPTPRPGTGTGLRAEYFDNIDFTNPILTRTDSTVNFDWGLGSPDRSIAVDTFSARWTGQIQALFSETYTFHTTSDDGVRLWVNNQLIIDKFIDQPATEWRGSIRLEAGTRYDIRMEYYENIEGAVNRLAWSSASQRQEIIPQSQLYVPSTSTSTLPIIALGDFRNSVSEASAGIEIVVDRTGDDLNRSSTVIYRTADNTAVAGADYVATSGTFTFAPGETRKTITIPIINDTLREGREAFTFLMDRPENANLGVRRTVNINIEDDDSRELTFTEPTVAENAGTATVTVTRANGSGNARVDFTTQDGTATSGSDYRSTSGTLTFASGELSKTISIPIINDGTSESTERFAVRFSNPVNVELTKNSIEITINDEDSRGITRETLISGLNQPTAFDWTPDGRRMFIAQKNGVVRVAVDGNLTSTTFIDISRQVNNVRDRGLLGLAIHPDFPRTPYVYLLFTYDPEEVHNPSNANNPNTLAGPNEAGNRPGRLIRVTADAATNYTTAVAGSEVVLLGRNSNWTNTSRPDGNSTDDFSIAPSGITDISGRLFRNTDEYLASLRNGTFRNIQDYIATDSESHGVGSVFFGTDGSLFVTIGDGTSYNRADPRTVRVQDLDNLSGKILRIDPITGRGYADNPFQNGNLDSNRSKVYSYGLRNPFRGTIDPRTNTPYVGDVGWSTWEEVNSGRARNFGWPFFEGGYENGNSVNLRQPGYNNISEIQGFLNNGGTLTAPDFAYRHVTSGNAILVGDFYQNDLIVGDVSRGVVEALTLNDEGRVVSRRTFDSDVFTPVQITTGPDGNLYFASLYGGFIGRWRPA